MSSPSRRRGVHLCITAVLVEAWSWRHHATCSTRSSEVYPARRGGRVPAGQRQRPPSSSPTRPRIPSSTGMILSGSGLERRRRQHAGAGRGARPSGAGRLRHRPRGQHRGRRPGGPGRALYLAKSAGMTGSQPGGRCLHRDYVAHGSVTSSAPSTSTAPSSAGCGGGNQEPARPA